MELSCENLEIYKRFENWFDDNQKLETLQTYC